MRRMHAPLPLVVACALVACGGSPGDLMAVEVTGGPPGSVPKSLVVAVDGRGTCNRRPMREISSDQLLEARSIVRDAKPVAGRTQAYPAGSPPGLNYTLRTPDGTIGWNETSTGLPSVLPRAELFALRLGRSLC